MRFPPVFSVSTSKLWRRFVQATAIAVSLLAGLTLRGADVPWAFEEQPYRALVRLVDPPTFAEVGINIELPHFLHMQSKVVTLTLTDSKGQTLPVTVLWSEDGDGLLLLAQTMKKGEDYYVYYGGASVRASPAWLASPSLLLETRRLPPGSKFETPQEIETAWKSAPQVDGAGFVPVIFQGENPFGPSTNFISKYTGWLRTKAGEQLHLFTVSSDASFVYVNGKYEFGWPGQHRSRTNDKTGPNKKVTAAGAFTKIEYYHAKTGPDVPAMGLLWKQDTKQTKKFEAIPANIWVHPGVSKLVRLEDPQGRPVPAPVINVNSYIGYGGYWLFETTCSLDSKTEGWTVTWQFDDGATFTGPSCSRIIPGQKERTVTVTLVKGTEKLTGFRQISFRSHQIREASVKKEGDLGRYIGLLSREKVDILSPRALEVDIQFLKEFAEDAQVVPYADAFVQRGLATNPSLWLECQLIRLHALAQTDPAKALAELRKIDTATRQKFASALDPFEADLLVFYLRDPKAADLIKQLAFKHKDPAIVRLLQTRAGDSYRILGRYKEAVDQYQAVQKTIIEPSQGRRLPAQDRAFSMAITELINEGLRKEAGEKLIEWESKHPLGKFDTDFLLLRARQLMEFGRWTEAIMELESFEKMQPESPYQVEADFYRALALHKLGQKEEAKKIWNDIVKNYPKHEFAPKSRDWAKK